MYRKIVLIIVALSLFGSVTAATKELVGGDTLNGNFNNLITPSGDNAQPFSNTVAWVNLGTGDQSTEATKNGLGGGGDGTRDATLKGTDEKDYGLDTGHTIAAGEIFNISYVWRDAWLWVDATDQVRVRLFVTDDNTLTGTQTVLVEDLSGLSTSNNTYETVDRDGIYIADALDAGKTLFIVIDTTATVEAYGRLDNFALSVSNFGGARNPSPADDAADMAITTDLSWYAGQAPDVADPNTLIRNPGITAHYVYLVETEPGTDPNFIPVSPVTITDPGSDPVTLSNVNLPITLKQDFEYHWRVDEAVLGSGPTEPNTIVGVVWSFETIKSFPVITANPVDVAVFPGSNPSFTCEFTSITAPTAVWLKDGSSYSSGTLVDNGGGNYTATLSLSGVLAADEGDYACQITNSGGISTSDNGFLRIKRQIGWWKLDGTLNNELASGGDGEMVVDAQPAGDPNYVGGIVDSGQAMKFFGDGQMVRVVDSNELYNFYPRGITVSLWAKTAQQNWGGLVGKQRRNVSPWQGFVVNKDAEGNPVFTIRQHTTEVTDVEVVSDDQWHLLVGTYDIETGVHRLYFDGLAVNETTDLFTMVDTNERPLVFGRESIFSGNYYEGLIDDIKIWNYAIEPQSIAQMYFDGSGIAPCFAKPVFDTDDDCAVGLSDFANFAATWLECGLIPASECP